MMTDTSVTGDLIQQTPSRRGDVLGWVFVLGGLVVSFVLGLLSDGIYMNDDANHYFYALDGWTELSSLLDRWGRVGYTIPTSPVAAWFGFDGCRVFSALQTGLLALLAWRTARRLIGPSVFAALAALFVWLQPLTFTLSMTTLTETTGALYMMLGIFLYLRGNRLWSCVAFTWLFLARDETMALAPLVALAMFLDARRQAEGSWRKALGTGWMWAGFALLAAGPILYVLATIPVDMHPTGDPLAIFTREYSAEYGTGPLYWMAARWSEQATPTIVALGLLGTILLIRALRNKEPLDDRAQSASSPWLLPAWLLGYFALHSVLFNRGMFAHGGEARYMIPLSGLLATQAAIGFRGIAINSRGRATLIFTALLLAFIALPFGVFPWLMNFIPRMLLWMLLGTATAIFVLMGALLLRRGPAPRWIAPAILVLAGILLLGQFQTYCRPLSLANPIDPMDKPLGEAAQFVLDGDFEDSILITKHPLIRLLIPRAHLRLPETRRVHVQWSNVEAIDLWKQSPAGTIFFWDSKNCNWPDPKEKETNAYLLAMLRAQGTPLASFSTPSWEEGKTCDVIVFEKLPEEQHTPIPDLPAPPAEEQ